MKASVATSVTSKRTRMSQTNKIVQKQAPQWFVSINNAVWLPEMKLNYLKCMSVFTDGGILMIKVENM